MATPLRKLLFLAMVTAYFFSESKVCNDDCLVVNVFHFANEGCNEPGFLARDRYSATESTPLVHRSCLGLRNCVNL